MIGNNAIMGKSQNDCCSIYWKEIVCDFGVWKILAKVILFHVASLMPFDV